MAWSDELKVLTRRALHDGPVMPDGLLHLKHVDGRYGTMALVDIVANRFVVVDPRSAAETRFADAEALIADGWAID